VHGDVDGGAREDAHADYHRDVRTDEHTGAVDTDEYARPAHEDAVRR
jgi:hypothetical protein